MSTYLLTDDVDNRDESAEESVASEAAEKLLGFHLPPEPPQDENEEASAVIGYVRIQKGSTLYLCSINIDVFNLDL